MYSTTKIVSITAIMIAFRLMLPISLLKNESKIYILSYYYINVIHGRFGEHLIERKNIQKRWEIQTTSIEQFLCTSILQNRT